MTDSEFQALGRINYEAWCKSLALKYSDNWRVLPSLVKAAWIAAARRVFELRSESQIEAALKEK